MITYSLTIENLALKCLILARKPSKSNAGKPNQYLFEPHLKTFISSLYAIDEPQGIFCIDLKALGSNIYALVKVNHSLKTLEVLKTKTSGFAKNEIQPLLDNK